MTESLSITASELSDSWQRLRQRWHQTTQVWDDRVRWQFEREFWQPLEAQVTATQRELEQLDHGISQAHCSVR